MLKLYNYTMAKGKPSPFRSINPKVAALNEKNAKITASVKKKTILNQERQERKAIVRKKTDWIPPAL